MKTIVGAVAVTLSIAGSCVAGMGTPLPPPPKPPIPPSASYTPPRDFRYTPFRASFHSPAIARETARRGWPHTFNRMEMTDLGWGVKVIHNTIRRRLRAPVAHRGFCKNIADTGVIIACAALNRRGRTIAYYPIRMIWEDGSVSVWLPRNGG